MDLKPFYNIEYLTIYKNNVYYHFIDNIHIKEIFSVDNDIICIFKLNKFRESIVDVNYIDVLYTNKITINNLIYKTDVKYITINEKTDELFIYYIIINE